MNSQNDHDTYIMSLNFVEIDTFFGDMLKARNVIEAGILAFVIGLPVFLFLPFSLTAKIIVLCLTALPLALLTLVGISEEGLSSFLMIFLKFLKNRRVMGEETSNGTASPESEKQKLERQRRVKAAKSMKDYRAAKAQKSVKGGIEKKRRTLADFNFSAEFDEIQEYKIEQELRPCKRVKWRRTVELKPDKQKHHGEQRPHLEKAAHTREPVFSYLNLVTDCFPITEIEDGIIYTKDHRYIKVVEVVSANFMLRSAREQRSTIYSFIPYLKVNLVKLQFKVLTHRVDISRHVDAVRCRTMTETNEQYRLMQENYLKFVQQADSREAVTCRSFLIFKYELWSNTKRSEEEGEAIGCLQSAVHTASNYLRQCGNEVIIPDSKDEFTVDTLYSLLCCNESAVRPLSERVQGVIAKHMENGWESDIDRVPANEFSAPSSIGFTHSRSVCIGGLYYPYLLIPSDGFKPQVPAEWPSLVTNTDGGIDLDIFLTRQPKERIVQKVGQQLCINRSRLKDASGTNTNFDSIDDVIRSGYFSKEGLPGNGDFYFLDLSITITTHNEDDLEWKVGEMKKLLLSQSMRINTCHFREEQAFLTSLPLAAMEKKLYEQGKRSLLTEGAASCYPFTSYGICGDNGILLRVNKYDNSFIIADILNSVIYKNANIAIPDASGADETFTMQLTALGVRRKGIQALILASLKAHEFHRACTNVGREFIQISPVSPHCISIMEIRRIDHIVNDLPDDPSVHLSELAAEIQWLHIFFSLLIPDTTREERQLSGDALIHTYNVRGITHDNAPLEDPRRPGNHREMPILGELYKLLKQSQDIRCPVNIINHLVNGSARNFNRPIGVPSDSRYTVLDISSLIEDMLAVGMFVTLDSVWNRARENRTEEKAIFVDECWQLLSGTGATDTRLTGDFMLEILKIIRGYGGSAICASQDLSSFFNLDEGQFGEGVTNSSKAEIILNPEDDEATRVQEPLHLSNTETMEVTHLEQGHGLISTNNNNIMVELKASHLKRELITTDRRELKELVDRKRKEDLILQQLRRRSGIGAPIHSFSSYIIAAKWCKEHI